MAFANLGKDQSDCLQESEGVEVLYDRMAAPGENPLNPLKNKWKNILILPEFSFPTLFGIFSYLAKLMQTEKKEDTRRTT